MDLVDGIVSAVDPDKGLVRVRFLHLDVSPEEEEPGLESPWLQVLFQWALGNQELNLPVEGTQVKALMDEGWETGVVLGSPYTPAQPAPNAPPKARHLAFPDGTYLQYDPEAQELEALVVGTVKLQALGKVSVEGLGGLEFTGGGPVTLEALQAMTVKVSGAATVEAFGPLSVVGHGAVAVMAQQLLALSSAMGISLTAPTLTLNGTVTANGQFATTGNAFIGGNLAAVGTTPAHHTHPVTGGVALAAP